MRVIVPKAACCLLGIDYRLWLLQEFRALEFGVGFGDMGNLSCMGCLSVLILIELLQGGVWAGLGLRPGEMKAAGPSRAVNGSGSSQGDSICSFPENILCCSPT